MEERDKIRRILDKATVNLCNNLDLSSTGILRVLKTKEALNDGDVAEIESYPRPADKVDKLLVLLKRKPAAKYRVFIEALCRNDDCQDLHKYMKELEAVCGLSYGAYGQRPGDVVEGISRQLQDVSLSREVKGPTGVQPVLDPFRQSTAPGTAIVTTPDESTARSSKECAAGISDAGRGRIGTSEEERQVQPDGQGSYESHHVKCASHPSLYHMNANKCYISMLSPRKGRAYILNVKEFTSSHKTRFGSQVDFENMKHLFRELGYKIFEHQDLPAEEIQTTLDDFVSQFHYDDASSVVVLMSHGGEKFICGSDGEKIDINTIRDKFKPRNCPALGGKPKLFFIQACRGALQEGSSVQPQLETDLVIEDPSCDQNVPDNADFYTAYATTEGFLSLRNTVVGSWFVQAILEAFIANAHKENLNQLMNQVTNRVCEKEGFLFFDQETKTVKKIRQTPQITKSLRKDVYFHPKYSPPD